MADAAIIFDVDGVLLELTRAEEEVFFQALSDFVPTDSLSRDWNSYLIRNDDDIIAEILERHGQPLLLGNAVKRRYIALLEQYLAAPHPPFGHLLPSQETGEGQGDRLLPHFARDKVPDRPDEGARAMMADAIPGASEMLRSFSPRAICGIATANLLDAAQLRLQAAGLWDSVKSFAEGADGGGHKHEILARLLARVPVPHDRIVYVGDNLNDLEAARRAGVHFIGFSTDADRLAKLRENGAEWTSENHTKTAEMIDRLLFSS
jgi:phosphoglycolate phosphatase-like HAD superfamily hydrolase